MPLDQSCTEFLGRTLVVRPLYGWGWHRDDQPLGPDEFAPIDAAGSVTFRVSDFLEWHASFGILSAGSRASTTSSPAYGSHVLSCRQGRSTFASGFVCATTFPSVFYVPRESGPLRAALRGGQAMVWWQNRSGSLMSISPVSPREPNQAMERTADRCTLHF